MADDSTTSSSGTTTVNVNTAAIPADVIQSWHTLNVETVKAEQNFDSFNSIAQTGQNILATLNKEFDKSGLKLSNMGNLTSEQSAKFGVLTTALIGARKSFENFSNVDTSRLSTFTGQADQLIKTLTTPGTAVGVTSEAIAKTTSMLTKFGVSASKINEVVGQGPAVLAEFAKNILTSADNALRAQNALIQLIASAGASNDLFQGLGATFSGAGNDLSNLNQSTSQYMQVLNASMAATGQNQEILEKMSGEIIKLPGGFKDLMSSMELGGKQTNLLTATVQYATGAGRDFGEVLGTMKQAMQDYGISGENALKFTSDITQVANAFGAQVEDVQSALMGSVDAFRFFAQGGDGAKNMTKGMTEAMNDYIGSLTNIGVPIHNALDMFKNYTDQVHNMSQAQTAFVSKLSGGPGGLMGGFQIDKLIKEGKFDEVQKKVQEAIKKITGNNIVSLEDATKSQGAAAQYTKQLQILQNGPLGHLARSRAEAETLLESMSKGTGGKTLQDQSKFLSDITERGKNIEQLSRTDMQEVNVTTMSVQNFASVGVLDAMQNAFTARSGNGGGSNGEGRGLNNRNQERLRGNQESAGSFMSLEKTLNNLGNLTASMPTAIKDSIHSFAENLTSGNQGYQSQLKAADQVNKTLDSYQAQISKMPENQKKQAQHNMDLLKDSVKNIMQKNQSNNDMTAGKQVGHAIAQHSANATSGTAITNHTGMMTAGKPVPVQLSPGTAITVNFTGACPHCGRAVHTSNQATIQNPASTSTNTTNH